MCFKSPKPPTMPKPQPAPTRRDAEADASEEQRRRMSQQQGVYGNIFTSALGDSTYGQAATKLARLGGRS